MGIRYALSAITAGTIVSMFGSLFYVLALVGLRKLLRREWAAIAVGSLLLAGLGALGSPAPAVSLPFILAINVIGFLTLARVGLVACLSALFVANVLPWFPAAWPPDKWYSGSGMLGIAVAAAIAIAAFRQAQRR
jgi:hypothetical protein